MPQFSFRIDFASHRAEATSIGPGKIRLLELIAETGSISAAGRAMDMSYRRAWLLINALNHMFQQPVVTAKGGGPGGGGASLTAFGAELVALYRDMQHAVSITLAPMTATLDARLAARK